MLNDQQASSQQAREETATRTAEQFFNALEQSEAPEAKYVQEVLPMFERLVAVERGNGRVPDSVEKLNELYSSAAYALPEVRAKIQQDLARAEQAKPKAAANGKATNGARVTRKVSSSATGGAGVTVHSKQPPKDETVEQSLKRSIAELQANA